MKDKNIIIENIVNAVGAQTLHPIGAVRKFLDRVERSGVSITFAKEIDEVKSSLSTLEGRIEDLCEFVKVPPIHYRSVDLKEFISFHLNLALVGYKRNFNVKLRLPELSVEVDILKLNEAFKSLMSGITGHINSGMLTQISLSAKVKDDVLRCRIALKGEIASELKTEMFLPSFIKEHSRKDECRYLAMLPNCYKHILAANGSIDFKKGEETIIICIDVPTTTPDMISSFFTCESDIMSFATSVDYKKSS